MISFLQGLFDASNLAPHGLCLLWRPELIWLHVLSDGFIGLAYFSIPVAITYFVSHRSDVQFGWVFWAFAIFIWACGTTHFFSIWTLWNPDYGTEGVIKAVTAVQVPTGLSVRTDEALANNWLEFWYQPIVNIQTGLLEAAELLARVRHPKYGMLGPAAFLPNADLNALLVLTERAIIKSCLDWQAFADIGARPKLAINVPVKVLTTLPIPALVRKHRPANTAWPGLILEVTEDQINLDIALAYEVATQLRLYDVSISIDDFGAGYSSLARLREMPFCELKIDREFVTNCARDNVKAGICQTIVDLAHHFGKVAVAEGIENGADLQTLHRMGCDMGQGHLIGRPMPKDQFLIFLQQGVET
jgi:EAL domain-containing protein (putative c-di-GMP-specific phosphodiesterase class I)